MFNSRGYIDYMAYSRLENLHLIAQLITKESWTFYKNIDINRTMLYGFESPIHDNRVIGCEFTHRLLMDDYEKVINNLVSSCFDYMRIKTTKEDKNV